MPDQLDEAFEIEERHRQQALDAMKVTGKEMLTGFCQNDCGTPTAGAYCSPECRTMHTRIMRNSK